MTPLKEGQLSSLRGPLMRSDPARLSSGFWGAADTFIRVPRAAFFNAFKRAKDSWRRKPGRNAQPESGRPLITSVQ